MNEETENLALEILKRLQGEFRLLREDIRGTWAEMLAVRQHVAGVVTHELSQDGEVASIKLRLGRIERRLDLID